MLNLVSMESHSWEAHSFESDGGSGKTIGISRCVRVNVCNVLTVEKIDRLDFGGKRKHFVKLGVVCNFYVVGSEVGRCFHFAVVA